MGDKRTRVRFLEDTVTPEMETAGGALEIILEPRHVPRHTAILVFQVQRAGFVDSTTDIAHAFQAATRPKMLGSAMLC